MRAQTLARGQSPSDINPAGVITGSYADTSSVNHGFLRTPDGKFTTFDAPGAGTSAGQGTVGITIDPAGEIVGLYTDASNVMHGFLRTPQVRRGMGSVAGNSFFLC